MILPTKYPKSFFIGESEYKLRWKRRLGARLLGLCDPSKEIIYIKKGMGKLTTFKVIVHELFHAFEFEYEIPIKHKAIRKLETAIADFILQNL